MYHYYTIHLDRFYCISYNMDYLNGIDTLMETFLSYF